MINLILVAAARPNFMKIAPLMAELRRHPDIFCVTLVHTGQHYDQNMSDTFFDQLDIPPPQIHLGVGGGSHAEQTAAVMIKFEAVLLSQMPDLVVVVGDVNATMACTLTAAKLSVPVAHVEAGLRSFDRRMPEEINRIVTDALSDVLYTPSATADIQLQKEGIPAEKIHCVGNIMIDTLLAQQKKAGQTRFVDTLGLIPGQYALVTLHRPSNVDDPIVFAGLAETLADLAQGLTMIFPCHPRTRKKMGEYGLESLFSFDTIIAHRVNVIDPVSYLEMLNLTMHAKIVLTDSGGLQEETTALRIPCVTVRENTERPDTVLYGSNVVAGINPGAIRSAYEQQTQADPSAFNIPPLWDGHTAARIVDHLRRYFEGNS